MKPTMSEGEVDEGEDAGWGETSRYAAHLDRGWALLDRGELDAARTSVQHAQTVRPDEPDATVLLGAIALAEGNPSESLRCYDRAIELDAEYLEPYAAAAAVCLYDLDDPARALRYLGEALELESLAGLERIDLHLLAAECELAADDLAAARERLAAIPEIAVLDAALEIAATVDDPATLANDDDEARAAAAEYLALDPDGEPLEDDERTDRAERVVGLALRLAQLRLDADEAALAVASLQKLVEHFARDVDAWQLLSEGLFRLGNVTSAAQAGLRALELDGESPLPSWVPTPAVVHRRVVNILSSCPEARIRALVERDPPPAILVRDLPPAEIVLEGVSPRTAVLPCAARVGDGRKNDAPALTALAIYRRNIARFASSGDAFEQELREAVLDELAVFFGLSARARAAIGLDGHVGVAPREAEGETEGKRRRSGPRRKRKDN